MTEQSAPTQEMEEIWRPIPGWPGYEVSNFGQVKSFKHKTPKVLKPSINANSGHHQYRLYQKTGAFINTYAHQLVMLAFVGPCPPGLEVCHFDHNPANNRLDNLRYDTHKANILDSVRAKRWFRQAIVPEQAREIRELYAQGASVEELAQKYNVPESTIRGIRSGYVYASAGGPIIKLSEVYRSRVKSIRTEYAKGGVTLAQIGEKYGMTKSGVYLIVHGKNWPNEGGPIKGRDY